MNRREEREQAFILLFEHGINRDPIDRIIDNAGMARDLMLSDFAEQAALGAESHEEALDRQIESHTRGWRKERLSKVALALLRLALYEMLFCPEIPVGVSINEAVELAKKYGAAEDPAFVNGVLGAVAKEQAQGTGAAGQDHDA